MSWCYDGPLDLPILQSSATSKIEACLSHLLVLDCVRRKGNRYPLHAWRPPLGVRDSDIRLGNPFATTNVRPPVNQSSLRLHGQSPELS